MPSTRASTARARDETDRSSQAGAGRPLVAAS